MPAFRATAGFFLLAAMFFLLGFSTLFVYAAEEKCDAASETKNNVVSNDCKICITTATGEKKWVGASCTVTGGGDKTSANCTANHGVAPGTCATKYCVGGKCFNAQIGKKPGLEDALGLKDVTTLQKLQESFKNTPALGASNVTNVETDPTAGQLDQAFEQSPSLEKVPTGPGSECCADLEAIGAQLQKAEQLREEEGRNVSVQVESTLTPEQRAQLLAEHGIDPATLDPQDPLRQYAEKGVSDTFGKPSDLSGIGSCTGIWSCAIEMAKKGVQDLFSGDQTSGRTSDHKATLYYPGGCTVGADPGCSPGLEGPKIGSKNNYIDRDTPVVAAGYNSGLKFGDIIYIKNPDTGKSTYAVVGDVCPACGSGIDLTPRVFNELGTYSQVNGRKMSVEVVSRGNSWSGGLKQVASLNSGSAVTWGGSIGTTPPQTDVTFTAKDWGNVSVAPSTSVASAPSPASPSGASSRGSPPLPVSKSSVIPSLSSQVAQNIPPLPVSKSSVISSLPITNATLVSEIPEVKVVSDVTSVRVTGGAPTEVLSPVGPSVITTQSEIPDARVISDVPSIPVTDITPSWWSETLTSVKNQALAVWNGLTQTPLADIGPKVELFDVKPRPLGSPAVETLPPVSSPDVADIQPRGTLSDISSVDMPLVTSPPSLLAEVPLRERFDALQVFDAPPSLPVEVPEVPRNAQSPWDVWGNDLPSVAKRRPLYEQLASEGLVPPVKRYTGTEKQNLDLVQGMRAREQQVKVSRTPPLPVQKSPAVSQPGTAAKVDAPLNTTANTVYDPAFRPAQTPGILTSNPRSSSEPSASGRPQVNAVPGGGSSANTNYPSLVANNEIPPVLQSGAGSAAQSRGPTYRGVSTVPTPSPEPLPASIPPPVRKPAEVPTSGQPSKTPPATTGALPEAQQQAPAVARRAATAAQIISKAALTAQKEGNAAKEAQKPDAGKAALDKLYETASREANKVISVASGTYKSNVSSRLRALRDAVASAKRGIDGVVRSWGSSSSRAALEARVAWVRSSANNLVRVLRNPPK